MTDSKHIDEAAAPHIEAFLQHLDDAFRRFGTPDGLPDRLREAARATPRHQFVHRFRFGENELLQDFDADPIGLLPRVYAGEPLIHVDADGAPLPSTNSEAAYVLWLVWRLGVEAGQRVLEIGSGSGWLLAIMAHLTGQNGAAMGVEIISSLADQARIDLTRLGCTNSQIITADATSEPIPSGPFDRVIITAATWDLPKALFSLVVDGGHLLVPLRLPRDEGCEVTLLRREGRRFSTLWKFPGTFVPLVGAGQTASVTRVRSDDPLFSAKTDGKPSFSYPLWFGSFDRRQYAPAAMAFRRYLAFTEPTFAVFQLNGSKELRPRWWIDFGLHDPEAGSAAIVRASALEGYGAPDAAKRLIAAYRRWCELGMPGPATYTLEVQQAAHAETPGQPLMREDRGDSVLVRRIDPQAGAWRSLLDERGDTLVDAK